MDIDARLKRIKHMCILAIVVVGLLAIMSSFGGAVYKVQKHQAHTITVKR